MPYYTSTEADEIDEQSPITTVSNETDSAENSFYTLTLDSSVFNTVWSRYFTTSGKEKAEEEKMTKVQRDLQKLKTTFGNDMEFTNSHSVGTFCFLSNRSGSTIDVESDLYVVYEECGLGRVRVVRSDGNCGRIETENFNFFVGNDAVVKSYCQMMNYRIEADYADSSIIYAVKVMSELHKEIFDTYVHLPVCADCGKPMYHRFSTVYGTNVCADCIDKYYRCSKCNTFVKPEDTERTREGAYLCPTCHKRHFVLPYHRYYPRIKFYGDAKGDSEPYMGFELEVDFGGESSCNVAEIMPVINKADSNEIFAYCSHDGSLQDGFEIITQPATLRYHQSIKGIYNDVAQKLKAMGYSSHDTTTCGFHVHVNRDFFEEKEKVAIERIILLTEKFWNEICIFARRPERRLERYAKKRPTSISIDEYMERADKSGEHDYHYYAVNIANANTIEFRMFKGTLNVNTIMVTLQLVENICKAAKYMTVDELRRMKFDQLLTTPQMRKYYARHAAVPDFEE